MVDPGELLASGRAADVFDQGDGTVLRRYRTDHDCGPEAELMSWLRKVGFLVPAVKGASGRDIIMELIAGPTMLGDLEARPWMVASHIRTLANLQKSLNGIVAPEWISTDQRIPSGRSLLHLDFHPMNVIMSPGGPVVIDWTKPGAATATSTLRCRSCSWRPLRRMGPKRSSPSAW
jgi:RIO-like serine/threonine protein kinase